MAQIAEFRQPLNRITLPDIHTLLEVLKPNPSQLSTIKVAEILRKEEPLLNTGDVFKLDLGTDVSMIGQKSDSLAIKSLGLPNTVDETYRVINRVVDKGSGNKNNYFKIGELHIIAGNLRLDKKGKKRDLVQRIRNHVYTQKGEIDPEADNY